MYGSIGPVRPDASGADATVLVTGATGFIGRQCLPELARRFGSVHAITSRRPTADDRVTWHSLDLFDRDRVTQLLAQIRPSHLLHLAWTTEPGHYWTSPENLSWIETSLHLARRFVEYGGRRLVTAGTCAEYEWGHGHCREATTPVVPATLYGRSKLSMQLVLESYAAQSGLSYASTRIFFVFGPGESPERFVPSVIRALQAGRPHPCSLGFQRRDFLHVADVAEAHVRLLESDVRGPVNVGSGQAVTLRQLAATLGEFAGNVELIDWGALPARDDEPDLLVADTTRLRNDVGFEPRYELREGLAQAVEWWQANGRQSLEPTSVERKATANRTSTNINRVLLRYRRSRYFSRVQSLEAVRRRSPNFDQIRQAICAAGTDSLAHFGRDYTHEGGLCLQQDPDEFAALCCFLAERRPLARYLEIGSASGGTAWFLNQLLDFSQMFSLDDGQHPRAGVQPQTLGKLPHCRQFRGDSHSDDARAFLIAEVRTPLDVALIDGDHSYAGVRDDIRLVSRYYSRQTLVVFHDTVACDGVARAWLETIGRRQLIPLAEFVAAKRPLGIGVAMAA